MSPPLNQPLSAEPGSQAQRKNRLPPSISRRPATDFTTRILIVDQDRQFGVSLTFMLATRQFDEVRAVRSPKRAIAVAGQFLPDIVFLDLELPDGGGIPLGRELARNIRGRRPRLIALTKRADDPDQQEARAAGFERLLVKPVSHEELDRILGIGKPAA